MSIITEELKALIGKQLDAKYVEEEITYAGKPYKNKSLKFAPGVLDELKKNLKEMGYEKLRFMYYGGIYTQDVRFDRLCIKIDNSGIISEVYFG